MKLWIYILFGFLAFNTLFIVSIHRFLSVSKSKCREILVVEGWISNHALKAAAEIYHKCSYNKLILIGEPGMSLQNSKINKISGNEHPISILIKSGINSEEIIFISIPQIPRHKTLSSALVFEKWLTLNENKIKTIDVLTETVHARKSYITYKKVLSSKINIGIIAAPTLKYNTKYWFISKTGIRLVYKNTIGCLYALIENKNETKNMLKNQLNSIQ